jgi:glycyl-tRNA synthetase
VKGPAAKIAFDADGNPTKAGQGFAKSKGLDVSQLERREENGVEYIFGVVRETGRPAGEVLAETLPGLIGGISWPKSMRWNASNVAFGRPIRWIVALLEDEVAPFSYADVPSGRVSRGIRSEGSPEFEITSARTYLRTLEKQGILLSITERKGKIWEAVNEIARKASGQIPSSAQGDLLDEVANLIEYPTPILGAFEEKYLELPREVLVSVMRKHQRYFPVETADGKLLPNFITVANGAVNEEVVRHGNQEVIRARYADATFIWEKDTKQKLEEFRPKLKGLTFQEQLGSMYDKSERLVKIIAALANALKFSGADQRNAERAAYLAKADLVTAMVMDFTSLQGIMGRHYAKLSGESDAVAQAIQEQYSNDPKSYVGRAVGWADRLDSLVGLFAVGKAPRSNADPFAQRRAAIGVVEILANGYLRFNLRAAIASVAEVQSVPVSESVKADVLEFITRRLEQWLLDAGFPPDVVDAAIGARGHDPAGALETAKQLAAVVEEDAFQITLTAFARPARITRGKDLSDEVNTALFEGDEERLLWDAYNQAAANLNPDSDFDALLAELHGLRAPIDRFFENVFVMAEDETVRNNRLALLKRIADLALPIADLSQLQGF